MRRIVLVLLVLVAVVAVLLTRGGDEEVYTVKMQLPNAGGLRDGSPVVIGGVLVGQVALEPRRDHVEVNLDFEKQYAPIGKDAVAGVIAQNVIGQKQVKVEIGDTSDPAPDGFELPAKQTLETTDLDQLLRVLDPDTRTRLAILINETGTAFAGRKMDFRSFLRDVPAAFAEGGEVLNALMQDNRALERLVATSDPFVKELADERARFVRVLDNAGKTTETLATRRAELRETLREAPGALRTARTFLAELRQTTTPLAETARLLTATAPSLSQVLDRLGPFERDAGPTIRALEPLGPILSRTANRTTAPLRKLSATTADAVRLAQNEIPPAGDTLDGSADNLIATLDNWSHAIQYRDGASHIFRGEASYAPDFLYQSLIDRLLTPEQRAAARRQSPGAPKRQAPETGSPPAAPVAPAQPQRPPADLPKPELPKLTPLLDGVLGDADDLAKNTVPPAGSGAPPNELTGLLDYLLAP